MVPGKSADKTYNRLLQALEQAEATGLADFMLRNREHLCAIRLYNGILLLSQMRYHQELINMPEVKATKAAEK